MSNNSQGSPNDRGSWSSDPGPEIRDPESGRTFDSICDYWVYYAGKEGVDAANARYDTILAKFVKSAEKLAEAL